MAGVDEFPSTHGTWILSQLDVLRAGGDAAGAALAELNGHVMRRYAGPLAEYVRASSLRGSEEPDELVNSFFASRLSREGYLSQWHASGLPLRRWLANGMLLHARERARTRRMSAGDAQRAASAADVESLERHEPGAYERFEREWARHVLSEAAARAEQGLVAEGRADAWHAFKRHVIDGVPYDAIARGVGEGRADGSQAAATGRTPAEAARTLARLGHARFERALREILVDEGVAPSEIDVEMAWLYEVSGRR
jgi:hypothetical protein